jgi:glycosyltransferase involved in cell wall biosynthesis
VRILHVIPAVASRYGGPSTAIGPMCGALADLGLAPMIVATDADGASHLPLPLGTPTEWQGVPALFFRKDFSESYKYSRSLAAWLEDHVRDFDIVHAHALLSHAPLAAAGACRRHGVPYIVRPLGTIARWSLGRKSWRKRALLALGGRRTLRDAAAIHYTSVEEKIDAEEMFGLRGGVVIPLGIDPGLIAAPVATAAEREQDRIVLVVSRIHPKKNLEALIEAFVAARRERPGWRLAIAGDGDPAYVRSLQRLVVSHGANEHVTFAGWIDGAAKRALVRKASVFALASQHENFGISVVEALAAGVPAFLSRQVHLAAAVEEAGAGWVVGSDVGSLRSGLVAALGNPAERESKGRAARELARQFTWPIVGAELRQLYRRIAVTATSRSSWLMADG